jgi:ABC-type glutathione transport system ATPase component
LAQIAKQLGVGAGKTSLRSSQEARCIYILPSSFPAGQARQTKMTIRSDNPIHRAEDDTIGRATAARAFAKQVLSLDASEGVVVGVLGQCGSGKTSFVNLARPEFEQASVPIRSASLPKLRIPKHQEGKKREKILVPVHFRGERTAGIEVMRSP